MTSQEIINFVCPPICAALAVLTYFDIRLRSNKKPVKKPKRWTVPVLCVLLVAALIGWWASDTSYKDRPPTEMVYGKNFRNQEIPLDGYRYTDCSFTNCTMIFKGRYPFQMINCFGDANIWFSPKPEIQAYIALQYKLDMLAKKPVSMER